MSIQLRDVEYFATIAEHGQVQRAASALGLSQPALSKSLARLEHALNAKLLKRTPKGVELTPVGHAVLPQMRRLRLALDDIAREAADAIDGRAGHLTVGTGPDLALHLIPKACAGLMRDAPAATMKITVGTADVLVPALARGDLDLTVTASVFAGHDDLVQRSLKDEEYLVYCSVTHRLARKRRVTLEDLAQERWILTVNEGLLPQRFPHQTFTAAGLPAPTVAMETNSVALRTSVLLVTDLLGFLPKRALHDDRCRNGLVPLPVKGLGYRRTLSVYHRRGAYLSPLAERFVRTLEKAVAGISGKS